MECEKHQRLLEGLYDLLKDIKADLLITEHDIDALLTQKMSQPCRPTDQPVANILNSTSSPHQKFMANSYFRATANPCVCLPNLSRRLMKADKLVLGFIQKVGRLAVKTRELIDLGPRSSRVKPFAELVQIVNTTCDYVVQILDQTTYRGQTASETSAMDVKQIHRGMTVGGSLVHRDHLTCQCCSNCVWLVRMFSGNCLRRLQILKRQSSEQRSLLMKLLGNRSSRLVARPLSERRENDFGPRAPTTRTHLADMHDSSDTHVTPHELRMEGHQPSHNLKPFAQMTCIQNMRSDTNTTPHRPKMDVQQSRVSLLTANNGQPRRQTKMDVQQSRVSLQTANNIQPRRQTTDGHPSHNVKPVTHVAPSRQLMDGNQPSVSMKPVSVIGVHSQYKTRPTSQMFLTQPAFTSTPEPSPGWGNNTPFNRDLPSSDAHPPIGYSHQLVPPPPPFHWDYGPMHGNVPPPLSSGHRFPRPPPINTDYRSNHPLQGINTPPTIVNLERRPSLQTSHPPFAPTLRPIPRPQESPNFPRDGTDHRRQGIALNDEDPCRLSSLESLVMLPFSGCWEYPRPRPDHPRGHSNGYHGDYNFPPDGRQPSSRRESSDQMHRRHPRPLPIVEGAVTTHYIMQSLMGPDFTSTSQYSSQTLTVSRPGWKPLSPPIITDIPPLLPSPFYASRSQAVGQENIIDMATPAPEIIVGMRSTSIRSPPKLEENVTPTDAKSVPVSPGRPCTDYDPVSSEEDELTTIARPTSNATVLSQQTAKDSGRATAKGSSYPGTVRSKDTERDLSPRQPSTGTVVSKDNARGLSPRQRPSEDSSRAAATVEDSPWPEFKATALDLLSPWKPASQDTRLVIVRDPLHEEPVPMDTRKDNLPKTSSVFPRPTGIISSTGITDDTINVKSCTAFSMKKFNPLHKARKFMTKCKELTSRKKQIKLDEAESAPWQQEDGFQWVELTGNQDSPALPSATVTGTSSQPISGTIPKKMLPKSPAAKPSPSVKHPTSAKTSRKSTPNKRKTTAHSSPKTPKTPSTPSVHRSPKTPKTQSSPSVCRSPKTPKTPSSPSVCRSPKTPKTPSSPSLCRSPKTLTTRSSPSVHKSPKIPKPTASPRVKSRGKVVNVEDTLPGVSKPTASDAVSTLPTVKDSPKPPPDISQDAASDYVNLRSIRNSPKPSIPTSKKPARPARRLPSRQVIEEHISMVKKGEMPKSKVGGIPSSPGTVLRLPLSSEIKAVPKKQLLKKDGDGGSADYVNLPPLTGATGFASMDLTPSETVLTNTVATGASRGILTTATLDSTPNRVTPSGPTVTTRKPISVSPATVSGSIPMEPTFSGASSVEPTSTEPTLTEASATGPTSTGLCVTVGEDSSEPCLVSSSTSDIPHSSSEPEPDTTTTLTSCFSPSLPVAVSPTDIPTIPGREARQRKPVPARVTSLVSPTNSSAKDVKVCNIGKIPVIRITAAHAVSLINQNSSVLATSPGVSTQSSMVHQSPVVRSLGLNRNVMASPAVSSSSLPQKSPVVRLPLKNQNFMLLSSPVASSPLVNQNIIVTLTQAVPSPDNTLKRQPAVISYSTRPRQVKPVRISTPPVRRHVKLLHPITSPSGRQILPKTSSDVDTSQPILSQVNTSQIPGSSARVGSAHLMSTDVSSDQQTSHMISTASPQTRHMTSTASPQTRHMTSTASPQRSKPLSPQSSFWSSIGPIQLRTTGASSDRTTCQNASTVRSQPPTNQPQVVLRIRKNGKLENTYQISSIQSTASVAGINSTDTKSGQTTPLMSDTDSGSSTPERLVIDMQDKSSSGAQTTKNILVTRELPQIMEKADTHCDEVFAVSSPNTSTSRDQLHLTDVSPLVVPSPQWRSPQPHGSQQVPEDQHNLTTPTTPTASTSVITTSIHNPVVSPEEHAGHILSVVPSTSPKGRLPSQKSRNKIFHANKQSCFVHTPKASQEASVRNVYRHSIIEPKWVDRLKEQTMSSIMSSVQADVSSRKSKLHTETRCLADDNPTSDLLPALMSDHDKTHSLTTDCPAPPDHECTNFLRNIMDDKTLERPGNLAISLPVHISRKRLRLEGPTSPEWMIRDKEWLSNPVETPPKRRKWLTKADSIPRTMSKSSTALKNLTVGSVSCTQGQVSSTSDASHHNQGHQFMKAHREVEGEGHSTPMACMGSQPFGLKLFMRDAPCEEPIDVETVVQTHFEARQKLAPLEKLMNTPPIVFQGRVTEPMVRAMLAFPTTPFQKSYDYETRKVAATAIAEASTNVSPRNFARDLVFMIFTIGELHGRKIEAYRPKCRLKPSQILNPNKIVAVRDAVLHRFPIEECHWWERCVPFINDSIKNLFQRKLSSPAFVWIDGMPHRF